MLTAIYILPLIALLVASVCRVGGVPGRLWLAGALFFFASLGRGRPIQVLILGLIGILVASSFPPRLRRIARRMGLIVCLPLAATATLSQFWYMVYEPPGITHADGAYEDLSITFRSNTLRIARDRYTPQGVGLAHSRTPPVWALRREAAHRRSWQYRFGLLAFRHRWGATTTVTGGVILVRESGMSFGLGFPLGVILLPTLYLWLPILRRVRPGHCKCGYDLTGNVSGVCPECGTAIQSETPVRREFGLADQCVLTVGVGLIVFMVSMGSWRNIGMAAANAVAVSLITGLIVRVWGRAG